MIRKMRLKFIAITMCALLALLSAILITTNVYMNNHSEQEMIRYMQMQIENNGQPPLRKDLTGGAPPANEETIEGFSVTVDSEGNILEILNTASRTNAVDAEEYALEVLDSGESSGEIGDLLYMVNDTSYGKIIVFANQSIQDALLAELRTLSYIIGGISFLILFVIVSILSKLVTKPVEEAFEKQKRFIADSSHELKTPLSILSANVDLLEMEIGENHCLDQMKQQSGRMNNLIHQLLILAKTESADPKTTFYEFNLSHAITNTVLPFEVIAFDQSKEIECDIESNISYVGDEQNIKKMVEALVDNAVKYSYEKSTISVKLYTKGTTKIIEIYNEGKGVTKDQKDRLFEKFYRADDSRARETGGYGIGLSIVKNIVDMHKGKIEVESEVEKYILFRITLPN